MGISTNNVLQCYHCGEDCISATIKIADKYFCCEGCKTVYGILNQSDLCDYYALNTQPGNSLKEMTRADKFAFLDDAAIEQKIIQFRDEEQTRATFYLPQVHCSSCLYLLENLHRINSDILSSLVNFPKKEVTIVFDHQRTTLRKVAELLASIGYEPYISLHDLGNKKPLFSKKMIYQLGVAGFCFGNIMLLSFPEYLGIDDLDKSLRNDFRLLTMILALPVLLYSAQPFFISAWKSITNKFLNIDTPIAIAILITFGRSVYEIFGNHGGGYFDSMSGIVFFMLAGRLLQNKTYQQLSFERDYTSYFPVAVTVIKDGTATPVALPDIKINDTLLIHHEELIPADGILTRGKALIDYSFVTGESLPVEKEMGEIVYAGGKQVGSNIEIFTIKDVAQSYLTQLWNKDKQKDKASLKPGLVDILNRYFTWIVLVLAVVGAVYWSFTDIHKALDVVTTVLIVACPCALLLSSTFTNGNILRILARNKFYLRDAAIIEQVAAVDHIVFDKTGTITTPDQQVRFVGKALSLQQKKIIAALAAQSTHPLSRAIVKNLDVKNSYAVNGFQEIAGRGIEGFVNEELVVLGSSPIAAQQNDAASATQVHVVIEDKYLGYFIFENHYRDALNQLADELSMQFNLSVVSGDTDSEKKNLRKIFGSRTTMLFRQQPVQKLEYIQQLQQEGNTVMMIGDGLNDSGALLQSDIGIAVAEDTNNFTPASDAILKAAQLTMLPRFIQLCRANRQIIIASFILSIVYNIIGLFFALQGALSPLIAAVLMPASSISILLVTFFGSSLAAKWLKL